MSPEYGTEWNCHARCNGFAHAPLQDIPAARFLQVFSNKTHHVLFAAMRRRTFSCGFPVSEMPNGAAGQHIRETISENTV